MVGVVFAAAVLSSLPPPPPAFALENSAIAKVGPGRVAETVRHAGYVLQVLVSPNKAAAPDSFALRITKGGQPVRGANVTLLFNHLEMQMPTQEYQLTETQPGIYSRAAPALVMVGRWGLTFQVTPKARPAVHRADRRSGRRMKPADAHRPETEVPVTNRANRHLTPRRRTAFGALLAAVLLAGCGGAGSGLTVPQVAPARVFSLGGFQPKRTDQRGSSRDGHLHGLTTERKAADAIQDRSRAAYRRAPDHRPRRPRLHHPPAPADWTERAACARRSRSRRRARTRCSSTCTRTFPAASRTSSCSGPSMSAVHTVRWRCRRSNPIWSSTATTSTWSRTLRSTRSRRSSSTSR